MKIYRLHMHGDFGDGDSMGIWFTRKSNASKIARQLKEASCDDFSPDPILEEFNVPSKKSELLAFLNRYCFR